MNECENCGESVDSRWKFCLNCGARMPAHSVAPAAFAPSTTSQFQQAPAYRAAPVYQVDSQFAPEPRYEPQSRFDEQDDVDESSTGGHVGRRKFRFDWQLALGVVLALGGIAMIVYLVVVLIVPHA
ncbi:MAG: zinc ribbon domain-containing protein [Actinomycetota bacterium]